MDQEGNSMIVFKEIDRDDQLQLIFNQMQDKSRLCHQNKATTIFQGPSHYDPEEIEKGYMSDYSKRVHLTKRIKKRKIISNNVIRNRKKQKNKLYIQMLQNKIFQLQKQLQTLKKSSSINKKGNNSNNQMDQIVHGYFINRQRHYQKMMNYIKQSKIDEERFLEEYGMLRMRQGSLGKDRIKVINYYFKELSDFMIPDIQKYILKTAMEQTDIFDPNYLKNGSITSYVQQWRKDVVCQLQLSYDKVLKISQLKEIIIDQKQKMDKFYQQFYNMKCKIMQSSRKIEMTYDRLNSIFSPREIAKSLCLIEKYKFQKGFGIHNIFQEVFAKLEEQQKQNYNPNNLYQSV